MNATTHPPTLAAAGVSHRDRRDVLRRGGLLVGLGTGIAALAVPVRAAALPHQLPLALRAAVGAAPDAPWFSDGVALEIADVIDNGAVVPLHVVSRIEGLQEVFVVALSNPEPLAAHFSVPSGTPPQLSMRIKLAASGPVYAVIRSGDRYHCTARDTTVVVGGCGG